MFLENSELHQIAKKAYIKAKIQEELTTYVANHYEDFESNWFENLEEDFVSIVAIENNVTFAFDGDLNVNIIQMD